MPPQKDEKEEKGDMAQETQKNLQQKLKSTRAHMHVLWKVARRQKSLLDKEKQVFGQPRCPDRRAAARLDRKIVETDGLALIKPKFEKQINELASQVQHFNMFVDDASIDYDGSDNHLIPAFNRKMEGIDEIDDGIAAIKNIVSQLNKLVQLGCDAKARAQAD